ncbi:MAG: nickel pincer cofactor biosynthesis protein LarC [Archaeoglobaceae archaeon]
MKVAIFDAFNGASGDMIIASLLGVTLKEQDLKKVVQSFSLELSFEIREVRKRGVVATRIEIEEKRKERKFVEVLELLERADIDAKVREDAKSIFEILAKAEGAVHGRDYRSAMFHEVGSDDAIFDVVCSAIGIRRLLDDGYRIFANPIRLGSGFVATSHGTLPVPTPAVLEILKNSRLKVLFDGKGELLTPTATAILSYYCEGVFRYPLEVERISYGAGSYETEVPNVLRLILGFSELSDSVAVLETVVDDLSAEELGFALEKLREISLDVIAVPVVGKKSRSATLIKLITKLENAEEMALKLMKETGSLGVRIIPVYHRMIADREIKEKEVFLEDRRFKVRFKISKTLGTVKPEFEDVVKIAKELDMPIFKIYRLLRCEDVHTKRE